MADQLLDPVVITAIVACLVAVSVLIKAIRDKTWGKAGNAAAGALEAVASLLRKLFREEPPDAKATGKLRPPIQTKKAKAKK